MALSDSEAGRNGRLRVPPPAGTGSAAFNPPLHSRGGSERVGLVSEVEAKDYTGRICYFLRNYCSSDL